MLIVGGGPAGSAAAITAAQHGLSVALVEALQFPRSLPGETLHPGVEAMFRQLGVWDRILEAGFHRQEGIAIIRDGIKVFTPYGADDGGPWLGFQADRSQLDAILLDRARALGVEVHQPDRIRTVSGDGPFETVLRDQTIRARWLVDAAGSSHWLTRRKVRPMRYLTRPLFCGWDWLTDSAASEDQPLLQLSDGGWTWRAPLGRDRVALASMAYERFEPSFKRQRDVTWRRPVEVCGPGWFVVGDAAGVLDPSSGKGVLRAMMTGTMASWLIVQVLKGLVTASASTHHYQTWFCATFDRESAALAALLGIELLDPT